jgi:hypothetical protein
MLAVWMYSMSVAALADGFNFLRRIVQLAWWV